MIGYLLCQNEYHTFFFSSSPKRICNKNLRSMSNALRTILKCRHIVGDGSSFIGESKVQRGKCNYNGHLEHQACVTETSRSFPTIFILTSGQSCYISVWLIENNKILSVINNFLISLFQGTITC